MPDPRRHAGLVHVRVLGGSLVAIALAAALASMAGCGGSGASPGVKVPGGGGQGGSLGPGVGGAGASGAAGNAGDAGNAGEAGAVGGAGAGGGVAGSGDDAAAGAAGGGQGGNDGGTSNDASRGIPDARPAPSDGCLAGGVVRAPGAAPDPNVAPGGNFDLSVWELQEPVGSPGSPTTIRASQLVGPNGFHDTYFFTDPADGAMSFWDPENGVTTANSNFARSELREMTACGAAANWLPPGTHTLSATVKATVIPNHVAVGQIHLGTGTPSSTKPLLELFYTSSGAIQLSIESSPAGGNQQHNVGSVPIGTKWTYVIGLSGNTISLVVNGGAKQTFAMSPTFDREGMYFKAGDYDQSSGGSSTVGARVHFYSLEVFHGP